MIFLIVYSRIRHALRSGASTCTPFRQNKNTHISWVFLFWWEPACTNRAENEQEFIDLMQRVKEFKEKWLISPMGEN